MSALLDSQLRRSLARLDRDLLWSLREAFIEAAEQDCMTDEALSAALRKRRLVISRQPPRPLAEAKSVTVWSRCDE